MCLKRPVAYILNLGLKKKEKMQSVSTEKEKAPALCSTPPPSLLGLGGRGGGVGAKSTFRKSLYVAPSKQTGPPIYVSFPSR